MSSIAVYGHHVFFVIFVVLGFGVAAIDGIDGIDYFRRHAVVFGSAPNVFFNFILAPDEKEALKKLANYYGDQSCGADANFTGPGVPKEYCKLDETRDNTLLTFCEALKIATSVSLSDRWYGVVEESCGCDVDCVEDRVRMRRFPGCECRNRTYSSCQFRDEKCDEWSWDANTDEEFRFQYYDLQKTYTYNKFNNVYNNQLRATSYRSLVNKTAAIVSSTSYSYSGLLCQLSFRYRFKRQTNESRIAVYLNQGSKKWKRWEYSGSSFQFTEVHVYLGAVKDPFNVSIECESGRLLKAPDEGRFLTSNAAHDDADMKLEVTARLDCAVTDIRFSNCGVTPTTVSDCLARNAFICDTPETTMCLKDARCDFVVDCENHLDEADCDDLPRGSRCTFDEPDVCPGWNVFTMLDEHEELSNSAQPDTTALTPSIRVAEPHPIFLPKDPARLGAGKFLYYSAQMAKSEALPPRSTAYVSPVFPPTNPDAYNPTHSLFRSCRLRYWLYESQEAPSYYRIAVIDADGDPFKSGFRLLNDNDISWDEWVRKSRLFPRQNAPFRIMFLAMSTIDSAVKVAIDELTFSPECFARNVTDTTVPHLYPDFTVTSCDHTGPTPLKIKDCDYYRDLDGQSGLFVMEDGTQSWTVPQAGFYRIEACGAAGGAYGKTAGSPGHCVAAQIFLEPGQHLTMGIGQGGENPCPSSSAENCLSGINGKKRWRYPIAAGGGGATSVAVAKNVWLVAGGGGGAADAAYEIGDVLFSGYGASLKEHDPAEDCGEDCQEATPVNFKTSGICSKRTMFVRGGFGGGGTSCDGNGGGGGGYIGGRPGNNETGENGSNFVDEQYAVNFGHELMANRKDGFVRIVFCRQSCQFPSVCRFRGATSAEQFCACPRGEEVVDHDVPCPQTMSCPLVCPRHSECVLTNFTRQPMCRCADGRLLSDEAGICFGKRRGQFAGEAPGYGDLFLTILALMSVVAFAIAAYQFVQVKRRSMLVIKAAEADDAIPLKMVMDHELKNGQKIYDEVYFGTVTRFEALKRLPRIDRKRLTMGKQHSLGRGNFGQVFHGVYKGDDGRQFDVAIKTISQAFSSHVKRQADLLNEALCMGNFQHENVTQLIGVNFDKLPYIMVVEYMPVGDLSTYLEKARPNEYCLNPMQLSIKDMIKIVSEVAAGCLLLEEKEYVHRDIAARNILLKRNGSELIAKIADFGMARASQSREGSVFYESQSSTMMPVKWTAPEAYVDGMFSSKSDVWSFGILCWEIFSLGVVPYPEHTNDETIVAVTSGERLDFPYACPYKMYYLMRRCWKTYVQDRPSFEQICQFLAGLDKDLLTMGTKFPVHPLIREAYLKRNGRVDVDSELGTPVGGFSATTMTTPADTPLTTCTTVPATPLEDELRAHRIAEYNQRVALEGLTIQREAPYISEKSKEFLDQLRMQVKTRQDARTNLEQQRTRQVQDFIVGAAAWATGDDKSYSHLSNSTSLDTRLPLFVERPTTLHIGEFESAPTTLTTTFDSGCHDYDSPLT